MAASSSASTCCFSDSSMPLVCESRRALAAAVPNAVLVEDRADTPDFTLVLLLHGASFGHVDVIRHNVV